MAGIHGESSTCGIHTLLKSSQLEEALGLVRQCKYSISLLLLELAFPHAQGLGGSLKAAILEEPEITSTVVQRGEGRTLLLLDIGSLTATRAPLEYFARTCSDVASLPTACLIARRTSSPLESLSVVSTSSLSVSAMSTPWRTQPLASDPGRRFAILVGARAEIVICLVLLDHHRHHIVSGSDENITKFLWDMLKLPSHCWILDYFYHFCYSSEAYLWDMLKLLFHCWILHYFYPIVGFLYEKNKLHDLQGKVHSLHLDFHSFMLKLKTNYDGTVIMYPSLQLVAQTQLHCLPQRTESCPRAESLPTRRVALHEAIVRQACESARFIRLSTPSTSAAASPITGRRHLSPPGTQEQNRSLHSQGSDGSFNSVVSASLVFGLDSAQSFALANHEPGTCIAAVSQRDQVPRP
ncbi:hypothetical protein SELMODRAFT_403583 [Selaginella moellendorffii]|uniref:Uncharacterized protein n=1 Tax=Selaginella moellendorffii TaxID=88036 RepID=D8QRV6_SELML|nr:hypothetical protein SELMODRAFT_403583 [Selaginella moellendorffii]